MSEAAETLEKLPLDAWHRARGGRMVPFAGYEMPVQYEGIMAEHLWTREHAGLFDVSHMGQLMLTGTDVAAALETLLPGDIKGLKPGRIRYSMLLADNGGIIDDLMVTNVTPEGGAEAYYMVVNGATKHGDIADLEKRLPKGISLAHRTDLALLALQGPEAAAVVDTLWPGVTEELAFMQGTARDWNGVKLGFGRSGYTGEDGFELSVPNGHAEALANLGYFAHEGIGGPQDPALALDATARAAAAGSTYGAGLNGIYRLSGLADGQASTA